MKKLIHIFLLLLSLFLLNSCIQKNPTFVFTNESKYKIDKLEVFAYKSCEITTLKNIYSNQMVKGKIIFCEKILGDGSYGLRVYSDGKLKKESGFSYYTNGSSLSNHFVIKYTNQNNIIITEN